MAEVVDTLLQLHGPRAFTDAFRQRRAFGRHVVNRPVPEYSGGSIRIFDDQNEASRFGEDARNTAHHYFRWSVTGWPVMAELPDTESFVAAIRHVSPETVAQFVSCGPSLDRHLEAIDRYVQAGYGHVILVQVGPDQDEFPDFFERKLAPALRDRKVAQGQRASGRSARAEVTCRG